MPDALSPPFLAHLQAEIEVGTFEPAEYEVGPVRQELEGYVVRPPDADRRPFVERLRIALSEHVRAAGTGIEAADTFAATEVHVQRYPRGSGGITPHRDPSRFGPLLLVLTTRGRARFTVHPERDADPIAAWQVAPGDLVLLRGPGLGGIADARPLHAVSGPAGDGPRYSLSVRSRQPGDNQGNG